MLHTLRDNLEVVYGALLALGIVVLLTPAVGGMARLLGVVDEPGGRRAHTRTIPRLGGLAMFLGFLVPCLAFLDLNREARGLLLGAAVATTVGAIDDFRGLPWAGKLVGQVAAALLPVVVGHIWVSRITFPLIGAHSVPKAVGMGITVFFIVTIMNMFNFLDGLDGLAAGIAAIAGLTFCVIGLSLDQPQIAIVAAVIFGSCVGFLRHNFYPARIFMGDSGALLLGFVLATISVQGLLKTAALATLVLPLLVLAIPILDTSFVIAKRLKHGQPVYIADRSHLHHRFEGIGFSQRRAVVYLYAWCAILAATALATHFIHLHRHGHWSSWAISADVLIATAALAASIYVVYLLEIVKAANPFIRRREAEAARSEAERKTA